MTNPNPDIPEVNVPVENSQDLKKLQESVAWIKENAQEFNLWIKLTAEFSKWISVLFENVHWIFKVIFEFRKWFSKIFEFQKF